MQTRIAIEAVRLPKSGTNDEPTSGSESRPENSDTVVSGLNKSIVIESHEASYPGSQIHFVTNLNLFFNMSGYLLPISVLQVQAERAHFRKKPPVHSWPRASFGTAEPSLEDRLTIDSSVERGETTYTDLCVRSYDSSSLFLQPRVLPSLTHITIGPLIGFNYDPRFRIDIREHLVVQCIDYCRSCPKLTVLGVHQWRALPKAPSDGYEVVAKAISHTATTHANIERIILGGGLYNFKSMKLSKDLQGRSDTAVKRWVKEVARCMMELTNDRTHVLPAWKKLYMKKTEDGGSVSGGKLKMHEIKDHGGTQVKLMGALQHGTRVSTGLMSSFLDFNIAICG